MTDVVLVFRVCVACIAAVSVLCNSIVLVALWKNKHLHTPSNVFIGHLCVADICVGLIATPLDIIETSILEMDFHTCILFNSLNGMFANVSVVMLLCVALERFVAIRFPFLYRKHIDVRTNMYYSAVAWFVGIMLGIVPLYGWHNDIENYTGKCHYTAVIARSYMVYKEGLVMFLVPMVTMSCTYTYIWGVVKRHKRKDNLLTLRFNKLLKEDSRSKSPFVNICLCFFIFRSPVHVFDCMVYYEMDNHLGSSTKIKLLLAFVILARGTSVINPFIYAGTNTLVRAAVINVVYCRPPVEPASGVTTTRMLLTSFNLGKRTPMYIRAPSNTPSPTTDRNSQVEHSEAPTRNSSLNDIHYIRQVQFDLDFLNESNESVKCKYKKESNFSVTSNNSVNNILSSIKQSMSFKRIQ